MATASLPQIQGAERINRRPQYYTPQPVHLRGFSSHRDPIRGTNRPNYLHRSRSLNRSISNIHERSVFEDTGFTSSYYIIHPDWTSEVHGRQSLTSRERALYGYDSRPAVHPLSAYLEPLLEKKRKRDEFIKSMEQAKMLNERHTASRQAAQQRAVKPQTPHNQHGQYKAFTVY